MIALAQLFANGAEISDHGFNHHPKCCLNLMYGHTESLMRLSWGNSNPLCRVPASEHRYLAWIGAL